MESSILSACNSWLSITRNLFNLNLPLFWQISILLFKVVATEDNTPTYNFLTAFFVLRLIFDFKVGFNLGDFFPAAILLGTEDKKSSWSGPQNTMHTEAFWCPFNEIFLWPCELVDCIPKFSSEIYPTRFCGLFRVSAITNIDFFLCFLL